METRANFALIGAFTLAVLAAAFMFVFWFSQGSKEGTRTIKIEFASSVSGLSRGSSVNFNGVRVGEVKTIELSTTRPGVVYASIEVSQRAPVKKDTRARLEYQGLTGVASIALAGGSEDSPALTGERGQPPVIEADRSDYQNILETLQRLAGRVETVLDNANNLFSENAASIARTVKNVETFSQALGDNSDGLKSFMQAMSEIGTSIKPMLANLEADSKGMIADVSEAAKSYRKLADNLDVRTKELTAGVNRFTGAGLRQYEALAADGRRTLDEINRTLRSLERNPQQLIFGRKPATPEYTGR